MFKSLCYGAKGPKVAEAQILLQDCGSRIKVNGQYTIGMIAAVRAFQKKNGLPITGKIDYKTMRKLRSVAKRKLT